MKVLMTGSTGLVGMALVSLLERKGYRVSPLVRKKPRPGTSEIEWHPNQNSIVNKDALEGHDAAIHLAGESVADGRWTAEKKHLIRESRVRGTSLLAATLAQLKRPPRVLASASAIGFYGDRGDEMLDETSAAGKGFLADVCREWESSTVSAEEAGIRIAHLRFGVVLDRQGGALAKLLFAFKFGAGGKLGSGKQFMSWIAIDDAIAAIYKIVSTNEMSGVFNIVAPNPVTNAEFTETLGRVLARPTIFSVPAFAARLAFGEMADEALLASQRVLPMKLKQHGFEFQHPQLDAALRHLLDK